MSAISDYKKKTKKSAKLFSKSSKFHVNGVSHNIRFYEPYPFVVKKSLGKNLVDVDDNKYTDYWMGHWSLILGHGPKKVKDSLKKQIEKSWMYGTVNEQTIKLSEIISKAVPVAEKIRYVTSGTEATMYAVRLARSVTGRKIIAKVDVGYLLNPVFVEGAGIGEESQTIRPALGIQTISFMTTADGPVERLEQLELRHRDNQPGITLHNNTISQFLQLIIRMRD